MASTFAGIDEAFLSSSGSTGIDVGLGLAGMALFGVALFGVAVVARGNTVAVRGKLFGRFELLEMVISTRLEMTVAIRAMDNPIAIG